MDTKAKSPAPRVLLIDDDAAIRRSVELFAEEFGFEVIATDDPDIFRDRAASWQPTVVVTDLRMSRRDGIQLLGDLDALNCKAPVILTSGADPRVLDAAVRVARELGVTIAGTLPKPFALETLRGLLDGLRPPAMPSREELLQAIEGDQLVLEFQPILNRRNGTVNGVEALVRWQHPTLGRLPPDKFLPLAEQTDLMGPLTDWVFSTAVTQAAAWHGAELALDVSINISARNLDADDLPERLMARCDAAAVSPEAITLEITESSAMREGVGSLAMLTRLRLKGFKLAMDDFGTAYSSIVQLHKMPFSELKIDRSFVMNMMTDDSCRVIVAALIDLARNLGLASVAEGVENGESWTALQAMGCDSAQGYHFSRPIAADRIAPFVRAAQMHTDLPRPTHIAA